MKLLSIAFIAICSLGLSIYLVTSRQNESVAFFDIDKVYEGFDMKKELESKMRKMDEYQNFMLDSLKFQIRAAESKAVASPNDQGLQNQLNLLYQQFRNVSQEFNERNEGIAGQYNKMVLTQIHAKAKDFCRQNGYGYLIGQSASTDLIFYEDKMDVSDDLILYLNKNYSGIEQQ